jgi:hypothetical protein
MKLFISGNVPSLKNSKTFTGKFLVSSKSVKNYLTKIGIKSYSVRKKEVVGFKNKVSYFDEHNLKHFFNIMLEDKQKPYKIGLYFNRDSKRKFDYVNICQIVLDLMVAHDWIDDDNADEVIPVFLGYEVNKDKPGVIISVLE